MGAAALVEDPPAPSCPAGTRILPYLYTVFMWFPHAGDMTRFQRDLAVARVVLASGADVGDRARGRDDIVAAADDRDRVYDAQRLGQERLRRRFDRRFVASGSTICRLKRHALTQILTEICHIL